MIRYSLSFMGLYGSSFSRFEKFSAVISLNNLCSLLPVFSFMIPITLMLPFPPKLHSSCRIFLFFKCLIFLCSSTCIVSSYLPSSSLILFRIWSALFPVSSNAFFILFIEFFTSRICYVLLNRLKFFVIEIKLNLFGKILLFTKFVS